MDSEGFYKIVVTDAHQMDLAREWGFLPEQVQKEILRDNSERHLISVQAQGDDSEIEL